MALPALKYGESRCEHRFPLSTLRRWLHGCWSLLFSHADDFACYGFETDRWLAHVREAFVASAVRPLAIAGPSSMHAGWVTEIGGAAAVLPAEETRGHPIVRDVDELALCNAVRASGDRFVMILDDALLPRRTFAYSAQDVLPSPIDLASMAARLRASSGRTGRGDDCHGLFAHAERTVPAR